MFKWDETKNEKLKRERKISFEELIEYGEVLARDRNKSSNHQGQMVYYIKYNNYMYKVPFVIEDNGDIFLKTAFPDRKLTREYKNKGVIK